ncbi:hypothetical protein GALMADRAFT_911930 [Galerina marginata CBS 339.88]|uniref:GPI inositol-deacylase n=1 Tax=Galerina marginata (strain CBS 339.88) TaxID=685588 RepID=A0A067SSS5_GALM3|nr:hypothetical protein GALMADRAFT_911930 [Galerina marginata CBS 339.88]
MFVHGFGGHYTDTWTSEGVHWPQEFLKSKLERARIISFAYDANISQFLPPDDDSLSPCALELLTGLTKLRADDCQRNRALIFVVHSTGSTVVKNVSSQNTSPSTV